jgi:hypothetical protein
MNTLNRRALLEGTISSIREHIRQLERQVKEADEQLQEKRAVLNVWLKELDGIDEVRKNRVSPERLPRGEARRIVSRLYDETEIARTQGLTVVEIANETKLKWSTARNVVNNKKNGFVETDGRWRRTIDAQPKLKSVSKPLNGTPTPQMNMRHGAPVPEALRR